MQVFFARNNIVYRTADGETIPTIAVIGLVYIRVVEVEIVSFSWDGRRICSTNARPIVPIPTKEPQRAVCKIDKTATDED